MRPIPPKLKEEILRDPYYKACARGNRECQGRITWEHSFIYGGRQINEKWAIIPLCEYHHLGAGLDKQVNRWLALNRATPEELAKYPRVGWHGIRKSLNARFGEPEQGTSCPPL